MDDCTAVQGRTGFTPCILPHVILVLLHRNQLGFFYSAREVVVCLFGFFVVFVVVVFFSVGTGPVWENVVE